MVKPTHDEIIRDLTKEVAGLRERLASTQSDLARIEAAHAANMARLEAAHSDTVRALNDLARQHAVLDERLTELKRVLDEAARRRWAVLPTLVGALAGAFFATLGQVLIDLLRK